MIVFEDRTQFILLPTLGLVRDVNGMYITFAFLTFEMLSVLLEPGANDAPDSSYFITFAKTPLLWN